MKIIERICEELDFTFTPSVTEEDVLAALKEIPIESEYLKSPYFNLRHEKNFLNKIPFTCPFGKFCLTVPCSLSECTWWVPFKNNMCCALSYIASKGSSEGMSIDEISFLLCEDKESISNELELSFRSLRSDALEEQVEELDLADEDFVPPVLGKCASCGRKIVFGGMEEDGFSFCTSECYFTKPPSVIATEIKFRCKIEKLVPKLIDVFGSVSSVLNALGLPRAAFYKAVKDEFNTIE